MRLARLLITAAVLGLLVLLVAREVRQWTHFDWATFLQQTRSVRVPHLLAAFLLINLSFLIRALRWKLLLWPHQARTSDLIPPTFIGFTAIALMGRAGEVVRPYLIARNEGLTLTSQLGVWTVERILDLLGFAVLVAYAFTSSAGLQTLPYLNEFRRAGMIVIAAVASLAITTVLLHRHGGSLSAGIERGLRPFAPRLGQRVAQGAENFRHGVRSMGNPAGLAAATALSILMWVMIAFSYFAVAHAYPAPLSNLSMPALIIVIGFSIAGGLVQLPGASTSQLIVIAALVDVMKIPSELAVSCGIMLWVCAYMAPVPIGLAMLRRRHLSLRALSRESRSTESKAAPARVE